MKTVAAFAFAAMLLATPVHSAEPAAIFDAIAAAADNLAFNFGKLGDFP